MTRCGAKTRSGEPCQSHAMGDNGRCRMHGGKASKTHSGNQNAKTHGIYTSVLTEEEKALWSEVELGKVDDELRICKLRLMRAIRAEQEANNVPELDARTEKSMIVGGVALTDEPPIEERMYKRRDYAATIDRLMGRIESLERTRADLLKAGDPDGDDVALPVVVTIERKSARVSRGIAE